MNIIYEYLPKNYLPVLIKNKFVQNKDHERVMIFTSEVQSEENIIFIIKSEDVTSDLTSVSTTNDFIIIGDIPHIKSINKFDTITVKNINILTVFNTVQNIFFNFNAWNDKFKQALIKQKDLQELCNIAAEYIHYPMNIQSPSFASLASTKGILNFVDMEYDSSTNSYYCTNEEIEDFKINKYFQSTYDTKGIQIYQPEPPARPAIYCNFYTNDSFVARLICLVDSLNNIDTLIELIEYFKTTLDCAFNYYAFSKSRVEDEVFMIFIQDTITGQMKNEQTMRTKLTEWGWAYEDNYLCMILEDFQLDRKNRDVKYSCLKISNSIGRGSCFTFFHDNHIIVIYNQTLDKIGRSEFLSHFSYLLRENLFKAGISETISNFSELPYAYKQAQISLSNGLSADSMQWYYKIEDFLLSYFLKCCTDELPANFLIPKKLKKLIKYDEENKSNYVYSLYIFLCNKCNTVHSATILDIHRSTLINRIKKIEELTGIDFDDPDDYLLYMLTFKLLGYENKEQES
jgi:hypothetical protein